MNATVTTHVLDTARGRPAAGVLVVLDRNGGKGWLEVGRGRTDADGRLRDLLDPADFDVGEWRLRFETGPWFSGHGFDAFYPEVVVTFEVRDATQHHHVPLLLSPFGYSTYRGS